MHGALQFDIKAATGDPFQLAAAENPHVLWPVPSVGGLNRFKPKQRRCRRRNASVTSIRTAKGVAKRYVQSVTLVSLQARFPAKPASTGIQFGRLFLDRILQLR